MSATASLLQLARLRCVTRLPKVNTAGSFYLQGLVRFNPNYSCLPSGQLHHLAQRCHSFHTTGVRRHTAVERPEPGTGVTYITSDNETITIEAKVGTNLLDLAHANNIDLEGACEGSLACSTCHVILDQEFYNKLEEPSDEENDMLDLAFGLTETSRLGCQLHVSKELDGIVVRIPSATRNVQQTKLK
ncbi:hypothetical protein BASA50_009511 [Batrachochytrium salamandrivorans]|uniref:2Fe-2S ferredoxin-type domain-containing protein n=1 Tax=Batrachochytrium salamandrivorans TaxID=1357716 RepID=A0ABQ8F161_9FUNG|nr:hypothetical protein BASA62_009836 [Batrachochytrium salamandrivorans]KAH6585766.1 hypothetical protein BASA61_006749 [Batrachochytrium salamandrivorans]KAH6590250.1 hypothetical protein BASA50_009511 [Batrachochytrium salamandrivorans]KAJ1345268.1 hypothetical protein BSLG_000782 [Batrachochytrium salamandrivorans]